ncbi:MAG: hypothetical protein ACKODM_00535, partial [Cytophagales bacterium]
MAQQCSAPAPGSPPATRCGPGSVTIRANSVPTGTVGIFRWYNDATGGTPVRTSPSAATDVYPVSSVSATTTFYVSFSAGCTESPRTPVTATVNPLPSVPNVIPGSRCGAGVPVPLYANTTAVTRIFNWYTADVGGTLLRQSTALLEDNYTPSPLPPGNTTYYVTVTSTLTGCESTPRIPVVFAVNASAPTTPTVTNGQRCGPGSVTLSASAGTGTFRWYSSASSGTTLPSGTSASYNTPSISSTTNYFVSFTRGSDGCVSTRPQVTATVNSPPLAPIVESGSRCGGGSVTLKAKRPETTNGVFRWYTALTGGTALRTSSTLTEDTYSPNVTTTTTYYVTFSLASPTCESSPRTPVVAYVNDLPQMPAGGIPGSSCGGNTVALRAISETEGKFKWYDTQTGGTSLRESLKKQSDSFTPNPLPSLTTNYYVSTTDDNGCESSRIKAIFSIDEAPAIEP